MIILELASLLRCREGILDLFAAVERRDQNQYGTAGNNETQ